MAKSIILCHFAGKVIERADYRSGELKWAQHSIVLHNAHIVANGGDLTKEFWFLKKDIKKGNHIITIRDDGEFVTNDPDILILLEGAVEGFNDGQSGERINIPM